MHTVDSVISAATTLSVSDRLKLLSALWDSVPDTAEFPLHADWAAELQRRVAAVQHGAATTPWNEVRDAALARIRNGSLR
jgi:putative addiction module component (TIGR02574 family)